MNGGAPEAGPTSAINRKGNYACRRVSARRNAQPRDAHTSVQNIQAYDQAIACTSTTAPATGLRTQTPGCGVPAYQRRLRLLPLTSLVPSKKRLLWEEVCVRCPTRYPRPATPAIPAPVTDSLACSGAPQKMALLTLPRSLILRMFSHSRKHRLKPMMQVLGLPLHQGHMQPRPV